MKLGLGAASISDHTLKDGSLREMRRLDPYSWVCNPAKADWGTAVTDGFCVRDRGAGASFGGEASTTHPPFTYECINPPGRYIEAKRTSVQGSNWSIVFRDAMEMNQANPQCTGQLDEMDTSRDHAKYLHMLITTGGTITHEDMGSRPQDGNALTPNLGTSTTQTTLGSGIDGEAGNDCQGRANWSPELDDTAYRYGNVVAGDEADVDDGEPGLLPSLNETYTGSDGFPKRILVWKMEDTIANYRADEETYYAHDNKWEHITSGGPVRLVFQLYGHGTWGVNRNLTKKTAVVIDSIYLADKIISRPELPIVIPK